jgi:hypothetical protein
MVFPSTTVAPAEAALAYMELMLALTLTGQADTVVVDAVVWIVHPVTVRVDVLQVTKLEVGSDDFEVVEQVTYKSCPVEVFVHEPDEERDKELGEELDEELGEERDEELEALEELEVGEEVVLV